MQKAKKVRCADTKVIGVPLGDRWHSIYYIGKVTYIIRIRQRYRSGIKLCQMFNLTIIAASLRCHRLQLNALVKLQRESGTAAGKVLSLKM